MWYTFFGVSFATGALLGAGLGDYLFHSTMEAAYNYQSMSSYPAVNPAKQKGQEIMDAGRVYFSAGSKLDLSKSMSFHNFEEYCIAPIVNGDEELASYDFWAVGTNCCSEGHFRCGEFANLHARSGLRYMEQEKQVSFQAAVQQAEAAYHLKAKHPLFFVWAQDPLAMINTKVATAQHLYLISVAIVFFTNLFAVIVNPPPVEGAEESLASTARAQSGDGAFVEAPKRNKSVSLPESKPNRPGLGRRTEKDEAQGRTGSIAAGPLPKAAQVQTEAGDGPAGGSKDQGGPRMKGRPSGAFPGLTQHLDPQVDEEEPPAGTPTGVGLAQHNGIRTRALSATKDFQQDEVILASDSTRVIRAADLQGRRFEGCPDDACRLALHVAERAKTGRDSFWTRLGPVRAEEPVGVEHSAFDPDSGCLQPSLRPAALRPPEPIRLGLGGSNRPSAATRSAAGAAPAPELGACSAEEDHAGRRNKRQASRIKTAYFEMEAADPQDDDEDGEGGEEDGQGWPKKSQTVSLGSVKSGVQLEEEEPQVQILSPGWRKLRAKYGGAAAFDQLLQQVRASNTQQLYEDDWLHTGESSPQTGPMARHRAHKAMCPYRTLLGLLLGGIIGAFLLGASPSLANAPDTARLEEGGGAELTGERLVRDVTKAAVTLSPRPALDTLPSSTPSPQPTPSPSGGTSQRPGKTNPIDFPEGRQTRLGDESSQQDRGLSSELSSASYDERLSHDAEVEQLELHGTRLHYRKVKGTGPPEGWVSLRAGGKDLLARERPVVEVVGPAAGYTHRWAVNIDSWEPEGGAEGTEFQFLLQLIKEKNERNKVLRFVYFADQKRALISRLLVRQASRIHVMSDGNMDFTGLCALENCSFILCPPANDRWHPWPFLRRLYDAAVILRTEFVILLEPDNTRLGERSFAGAEYVQRLAQDRRPGFKWTRVNQEAGLCGGSYYRTAAILDAFADESLGPEAYAAERREKRRKTGEEPESSDEDVEEMLGRFETVRQAAGARWSVGHR
eukprot:g27599.t3